MPRLPSREDLEGIENHTHAEAEEIVNAAKADLDKFGFTVNTLVEWGPTPDVILEVADTHGFDLIAMGRHGADKVSDLIVGSVSDRVMRRSKIPVLILETLPNRLPTNSHYLRTHLVSRSIRPELVEGRGQRFILRLSRSGRTAA